MFCQLEDSEVCWNCFSMSLVRFLFNSSCLDTVASFIPVHHHVSPSSLNISPRYPCLLPSPLPNLTRLPTARSSRRTTSRATSPCGSRERARSGGRTWWRAARRFTTSWSRRTGRWEGKGRRWGCSQKETHIYTYICSLLLIYIWWIFVVWVDWLFWPLKGTLASEWANVRVLDVNRRSWSDQMKSCDETSTRLLMSCPQKWSRVDLSKAPTFYGEIDESESVSVVP